MRRHIPSMSALLAFEAAGRLCSFTLAADELAVSQGAVSRQIRVLEGELGVKLFSRMTRKVELTNAGRQYFCEVQYVLEHVERATAQFRAQRKHTLLTINSLPSVASFRIMHRLANFCQRYPGVETRIVSSIRPVDLHSGEADVAIRVGALPGAQYDVQQPRIDLEMVANWRGVRATWLYPDILIPVYSSKLVHDPASIERPADLLKYPLIHTSSRRHAWSDWLRSNDLEPPREPEPIEYGHFFISLEAAREGQGVAIVPNFLLTDVSRTDLISPFEQGLASAGEYYLLSLEDRADEDHIVAFREWLTEQVRPKAAVKMPGTKGAWSPAHGHNTQAQK